MNDKKLDLILSKVEKIDKLEADMQGMKSDMQDMKSNMQRLERKVDNLDEKVDALDERVGTLDEKVGVLDEKVDALDERVGTLDEKVGVLDEKVGVLDEKVDTLDEKVRGIQLHLENNTDRNIQFLAENFIELTNKLNLAIPVADKNYAYEVKVNYLIEEVQEIKKKIASGGLAAAQPC